MQDTRLCFLGRKSVSLDERHKFPGAAHDGGESEKDGEARRMVGEDGEGGDGELKVESGEEGGCEFGGGRVRGCEVEGVDHASQNGEGNGEVDGRWVGWVAAIVSGEWWLLGWKLTLAFWRLGSLRASNCRCKGGFGGLGQLEVRWEG